MVRFFEVEEENDKLVKENEIFSFYVENLYVKFFRIKYLC